ncbi:MAG: rubrerythrin family protein [Lachnospiraceae bacterium]|nr:rubrerythrin family protein [Lachnospiraceae bacterium]MDE6963936.1 rubrerythrin family protein [Lachnospiraceae bacterium]
MEERCLTNNCSFAGVKPIMVDLPYPEIKVRGRNRNYADLLNVDYCGFVSELSAITQYINNENRISFEECAMARTLLGIAIAEMMHLQKLGELIVLLGGNVDFSCKTCNGRPKLWSPEYLTIPENIDKMLTADIEAEKDAIRQYEMHIKMIDDDCVNAVLRRIILDEEYHIMLLKSLRSGT